MTNWRPVPTTVLDSAFAGVLAVDASDGLRPLRMPTDLQRRSPEGLVLMTGFTSGVRLRLLTSASRLRVTAAFTRYVMAHLGHPISRAELLAEVDGEIVDRATADPTGLVHERRDAPLERGPEVVSTLELALGSAAAPREVVVWLPADAGVRLVAVEADADVAAAPPSGRPRWVHHGSSISHGGDAADARSTWPAQAARALGLDGVNLGFGGNAQLDPSTARAIARTPADVVTLKLGINVVHGETMRLRTFLPALHGFLDTIREARPDVPIVVLSAVACPMLEDVPAPRLSLQGSRDAIAEVLAARSDDPRLWGMDGRELLGPDDASHLYDGLHPDPAGYDLMAARFVAAARDPRHPLGQAFSSVG